jgi:hypothetical protein
MESDPPTSPFFLCPSCLFLQSWPRDTQWNSVHQFQYIPGVERGERLVELSSLPVAKAGTHYIFFTVQYEKKWIHI